ncbi:MAG: pyridoxal phosphate-dependent aminotransferase [Proteobacteria bacterium]|nr:pyridoxal phosphate-dependent aminotransferase [Pseudomonadota bacterium]
MKTAKWLESIIPSPTLAVNQKVMELKSKGKKIISLVVGEPDFETPEFIKNAAIEALKKNYTKYTETQGIIPLREAICEKLKRENGLNYEPSQIIVTCGAKQAISTDLEKVATTKTKVLILNNPSNPTGVLYNKDELLKISEWCLNKGIVVISDEIYERIVFSGRKFVSVASFSDAIYNNTITINGLSKSHCMTGWRMGYAAGPKNIIKAMSNFQSHFLSHITTFVQYASVEALKNDSFIPKMVIAYEERINTTIELMKKYMPLSECVAPDGAFYIFPTVNKYYGKSCDGKTIKNSVDMATFLLEAANVAVVPGLAFGMDNNIRLSVATSLEEIKDGLAKIGQALGKLK